MSKKDMKETLKELKLKLNSLEDASYNNVSFIKRLQLRIEALESGKSIQQPEEKDTENVKNWEEIYLKEKSERQKAEEELYFMKEALQHAEEKLNELTKNANDLAEMQSMLEARLNEAHSLQNKIGELQRALEGAAEREKDLQQELESTGNLYKEYTSLHQQNAHLQSENEELRNRIAESNNRDIILEQHIKRLAELESTFETIEYEKMEIKNTVDAIVAENTTLSLKLNELQDKLATEKYVN
jgi:regulator of replication initiation timing